MSDHTVRSIIKRPEPLRGSAKETVRDACRRMAEEACSSILICESHDLKGIFTERDLLVRVVAAGLDPDKVTLGEVMTGDPDTIDGAEPVVEAIRRMDEGQYRHLPVTEQGKVVGVVAIRDLPLEDLSRMQPELDQRHELAERIW